MEIWPGANTWSRVFTLICGVCFIVSAGPPERGQRGGEIVYAIQRSSIDERWKVFPRAWCEVFQSLLRTAYHMLPCEIMIMQIIILNAKHRGESMAHRAGRGKQRVGGGDEFKPLRTESKKRFALYSPLPSVSSLNLCPHIVDGRAVDGRSSVD